MRELEKINSKATLIFFSVFFVFSLFRASALGEVRVLSEGESFATVLVP